MMGEGRVLGDRAERGNAVTLGSSRGKPQIYPAGIRQGSSQMATTAQPKRLHTNARSTGNQQEFETVAQLEKCDRTAITETWWDESHDWKTATEGYRLLRRDRQGRRGGGVALYVRKRIDCKELCLRNSHDQLRAYGFQSRIGSGKDIWRLGSATGHLSRGSLLSRPSCFSCKKCHARRFLSRWRISTTRIREH